MFFKKNVMRKNLLIPSRTAGHSFIWCMLVAVLATCSLVSCKEEEQHGYLEHDTTPPEAVSNVQVEPLPGAADISYSLPENSLDLLYVKARYEIRPGVKQEASTSFYGTSILVAGFGDTAEHKVELVSVDRSGNMSEPVEVNVKPKYPPVQQVYDSLTYAADFGGIRIISGNPSKADLMVGVLIKDSLGDWVDYDRTYSALREINFTSRGLPAELTSFGVYVRDRWHNYSDTLIQDLVPLFEEQLDPNNFQALALPGDDETNTWSIPGLWDNNPGGHNGVRSSNGTPSHYQFSIVRPGQKAKISRFKIWGIFDGREYTSANIKDFEVWGSDAPASDGSFDGWTLMGTFEIKKPSGLPSGQLSNDDKSMAAAGFEFDMPFEAPAVRYIRINVLSTFASPPNSETGDIWMTEVAFWGQLE